MGFIGFSIWFAYMAIDSATYRLRYDAAGFTVSRFLHAPTVVRWDQVRRVRHTGYEWLLELDHPDKRTLTLWINLVGLRGFLAELQARASAQPS